MFNPIRLELKASSVLACLLALPFLSSIVLIFTSSLPFYWKGIQCAAALALLSYLIWHHALLLSPRSIRSILLKDQQFVLTQNNGDRSPAVLRTHTLVLPWLCLFYFEQTSPEANSFLPFISRYRFVVAFHYNTSNIDSLRRLRARLIHDSPSSTHVNSLLHQK